MQGQVWLTLGAAAIGAISALFINWLTRRSERKRDDLRWEREAAERRAEREHDARMQWRESRLDAYTSALSALDGWRSAASRAMTTAVKEGSFRLSPADLSAADLKLADAFVRVSLIGSHKARTTCPRVGSMIKKVWDIMYVDGDVNKVKEVEQELTDFHTELENVFRDDLGVTSPPSDPSS